MRGLKHQKIWQKVIVVIFLATVVLSIIAEVSVAFRYYADKDAKVRLEPNTAEIITEGWYYLDETGDRVDIDEVPGDYPAPGGTQAFYHSLSAEEVSRGILLINTIRQNFNVYADGELIYTMGRADDTIPTSVNGYMLVELPESSGGYDISIEFFLCRNETAHLDAVSVCTPAEAFVRLTFMDFGSIVLTFLAIFVTVLLLIFSCVTILRRIPAPRLHCLTYLMVSLASWMVLNLWSATMYPMSSQVITQLNYSAFLVLPIAIGLYAFFSTKHHKSKLLVAGTSVFTVVLACQLILSLTNTLPLYEMLNATHVGLLVMTVLALVSQIQDFRIERSVPGALSMVSFAFAPVTFIISVVMYRVKGDMAYMGAYVIGMTCFALMTAVSTIYSLVDELRTVKAAKTELEIYHKLSVKDGLTGLGNRRAFDDALNEVEDNGTDNAILFFMDLNDLKSINDTYGHSAGDLLIQGAAECITESFAEEGSCFRLGGDEFSVLLPVPDKSIEEYIADLEKAIETYNQGRTVVLSMAKGAAYRYDADHIRRTTSLWKSLADRAMYADKMRMKMFVNRPDYIGIRSEDIDPLTGILTAESFRRAAMRLIFERTDEKYAIWYIDIKEFKFVNDFFGYEQGDRLLKYWAQITLESISDGECCGRIAADKFAVMTRLSSEAQLAEYFEYISHSLMNFFKGSEIEYHVELAAGVYLLKQEDMRAPNINSMLDWANVAHKSVRDVNGSRYSIFGDEMWQEQWREQYINQALSKSLDKGEITLWLQPQYNYLTGRIVGAEALCRWTHSDLGWLSPGEFIPALEKTGKITLLDSFIREKAFELAHRWRMMESIDAIPISINISRVDVMEPRFIQGLNDLCDKYEVPADAVHLEITESAYMDRPEVLKGVVTTLHEHGFVVEMDDFGSGFSSLNMLKEIPVDRLKLDIGFVSGEIERSRGATIVSSIVKMSDELGMRIIAEGIETLEQARFMSSMGCQMMQGYYFSKPVTVEEFEELLKKNAPCSDPSDNEDDLYAQQLWHKYNNMAKEAIEDGSIEGMECGEVEPVLFSEFQISVKNGVIVLIDDNFEKMTGYGWNDIRELELREIDMIPDNEKSAWWIELFRQMSVKSEMCVKHTLVRKDGSRCVVSVYGRPHIDSETGEARSIIRMAMVRELP